MDGDFILKNASIVDGSGTPSYSGHVHVSGNKIEAIFDHICPTKKRQSGQELATFGT